MTSVRSTSRNTKPAAAAAALRRPRMVSFRVLFVRLL
jgi:hypothetical protein